MNPALAFFLCVAAARIIITVSYDRMLGEVLRKLSERNIHDIHSHVSKRRINELRQMYPHPDIQKLLDDLVRYKQLRLQLAWILMINVVLLMVILYR